MRTSRIASLRSASPMRPRPDIFRDSCSFRSGFQKPLFLHSSGSSADPLQQLVRVREDRARKSLGDLRRKLPAYATWRSNPAYPPEFRRSSPAPPRH